MNHRVSMELPGIFNGRECLWFLHRGYDDCLYKVYDDRVRRAFSCQSELMLVDIFPGPEILSVEWLTGKPSRSGEKAVAAFVADWFDLTADLHDFYRLVSSDPRISALTAKYRGLRLMGIPDLFEALCWAIMGQQINLTFAYTLKRRLVEAFGTHLEYDNGIYHVFPAPERLAGVAVDALRTMQFSTKKAEYLITIARAFADGSIGRERLMAMPDTQTRIQALTAVRGIGAWTANYALMKSLHERSSVPYGDAGLVNALMTHDFISEKRTGRG